MGSLIEDPQVLEPCADAPCMPAIAVVRNHQLVPIAATGMASDRAPHRLRRPGDDLTIFFGGSCVPKRSMRQVATIPNQMTQQCERLVRPLHRMLDPWKLPRQGDSGTR